MLGGSNGLGGAAHFEAGPKPGGVHTNPRYVARRPLLRASRPSSSGTWVAKDASRAERQNQVADYGQGHGLSRSCFCATMVEFTPGPRRFPGWSLITTRQRPDGA